MYFDGSSGRVKTWKTVTKRVFSKVLKSETARKFQTMNKYTLLRSVFTNHSKIFSRIHTPLKLVTRHDSSRRAFLYVPGSDLHKLEKAFQLKVDCIVMDCEDGVALNSKEEARNNIVKFLNEGPVSESDPEWCVRINGTETEDLFEADLRAILSAKYLPISVCLPKVNTPDQLQLFAEKVWNELLKRPEDNRGPIKLIMIIESALSIMTLPEICQKARDLSTMAPIVPVALVIGSDDLLASIGAKRTQSGIELLYARQKLVLVAKAFGLQAIDMVFLNIQDVKGFTESCIDGALLGYTGKQVIHPEQVVIAQENFVPSRNQIQWAKKIIKIFKKNQEIGKGAFVVDNNMIDMPTVLQAENILKTAKAAGKSVD